MCLNSYISSCFQLCVYILHSLLFMSLLAACFYSLSLMSLALYSPCFARFFPFSSIACCCCQFLLHHPPHQLLGLLIFTFCILAMYPILLHGGQLCILFTSSLQFTLFFCLCFHLASHIFTFFICNLYYVVIVIYYLFFIIYVFVLCTLFNCLYRSMFVFCLLLNRTVYLVHLCLMFLFEFKVHINSFICF